MFVEQVGEESVDVLGRAVGAGQARVPAGPLDVARQVEVVLADAVEEAGEQAQNTIGAEVDVAGDDTSEEQASE